ncbi:MAG: hypothetical protein O3A00_06260 [Planctomycetota bacterium]|nr:hypothetical protein [Planctomycetota bacterium]
MKRFHPSNLIRAALAGLLAMPVVIQTVRADDEDDFFRKLDRSHAVQPVEVARPVNVARDRGEQGDLKWWAGKPETKPSIRPAAVQPSPSARLTPATIRQNSIGRHRPSADEQARRTESMRTVALPKRDESLKWWPGPANLPKGNPSSARPNELLPVPAAPRPIQNGKVQLTWWQEKSKADSGAKGGLNAEDVAGKVNLAVAPDTVLNKRIDEISVNIGLPKVALKGNAVVPVDQSLSMKDCPPVKELCYKAEDARVPIGMHYCFYHRPLYYEDSNLERCGVSLGLYQNLVSATHFVTTTALLPYRLAAEPPQNCVWGRGECRQCTQYSFADNYLPPLSSAGALAEGAAITGLILIIP